MKLHIADVCDFSSFLEGCLPKLITICVFGNPVEKSELAEEGTTSSAHEVKPGRTLAQNATLLSFCFVGLQVSPARRFVVRPFGVLLT